jgi:signal transduction histidine kinase
VHYFWSAHFQEFQSMKEYIPSILIVDDIKENIQTLEMNMRSLNAQIITALNGMDALELIKTHDFALMIIDVQMPELNGFELAEMIRNGRRNRHTPIIFLTAAYYDQNSIHQGYRAGAVDYITKPFNREILLSKARIFLELDKKNHELCKAKQEFQSIVQDQTDLICRTDRDFNIIFTNRALLIALTLPFGSLRNKNILHWMSQKDVKKIKQACTELSPTNAIFKINHGINVSASRTIIASTIVRALFDKEYELTGYQLVMRDITTETKIKEDLLDAKIAAENTTRTRSQFLANMSHEIRTPMNSIIGLLQLLQDSQLDDDQKENIEVIQFSANKLMTLLDDIIDFSKIDSGHINLHSDWFNLKELLIKTTRLLEPAAKSNGNTLVLSAAKNLPEIVKGDELRLGQILVNLINNANKFTKKGKIELKVDQQAQNKNMVTMRFTVTDNGIGMSENIQNKIFQIYEQADPEIFRQYGGSGLGLAISKALCEKMGGSIHVSSIQNEGTSFWIDLNFETKNNHIKMKNTTPEILLVEDNKINRLIIENVLKRNNFKFDIAENGQIAVEKFKEKQYAVIIMDLQMPVMDGFTATANIRELEKESNSTENCRIVAHSANNSQEDQKKCAAIGMDAFLEKSGDTKPLINCLRKFTNQE